MELRTIMRNITPSLTIMVIGIMGAHFVYSNYFSERIATSFANFEPAAGEETFITPPADASSDEIILDKKIEKDIMDEIEAGIKSLN